MIHKVKLTFQEHPSTEAVSLVILFSMSKNEEQSHTIMNQNTANAVNVTSASKKGSGALFVALGILLSRISGLIRERVFAHYFGNSWAGDAFKAALKIPNFLQNLFGEGVLSASFIPVYANLLKKDSKEASQVAQFVGTLLFLLVSCLVIVGVLTTPWLVDWIAPGFENEKRNLTIQIVKILFPGTGLLVMSAWCLGILNSHHRFFLSYFAPVLWNLAIIFSLIVTGKHQSIEELALTASYGLVLGSLLQFGVQLPTVYRLLVNFKFRNSFNNQNLKMIVKNFVPVVVSRGVVQVVSFIDSILASFLPTGAVSAIAYSQTLYMLPISLFAMSVSAAELPSMSQIDGDENERTDKFQSRLNSGLSQISFFVIPSMVAFILLGHALITLLFRTGQFSAEDVTYVWLVLIGQSLGLLATTQGRLYSSTFYALKDTVTPLKFSIVRVFFSTALGVSSVYLFMHQISEYAKFGAVALTFASGVCGWIEYLLLKKRLDQILMLQTGITLTKNVVLFIFAIISALPGIFIMREISDRYFLLQSILALLIYGLLYFMTTYMAKIPESQKYVNQILSKTRRLFSK